MDYLKEELRQYLPGVEDFLATLLLEEADIEVVSSKETGHAAVLSEVDESSIFLYTRDSNHQMDVIVILDEEWYGLLSSIMLGIEVKERNDDTIDLLKEFAGDLSDTVLQKMEDNADEMPELEDIQVLTLSELEEALAHTDYLLSNMEVKGIADDPVIAGCLFGDPDALLDEDEAADEEQSADGDQSTEEKQPAGEAAPDKDEEEKKELEPETEDFTSGDKQEAEYEGSEEEIIFGRHTVFEGNAMSGRSQDHNINLLKDVELDVHVELGRAELPLGKVLQLAKGSVLELEELAGEPVYMLVNGHRIADGEVVVIDEHFGVRISNFTKSKKQLAGLQNES